MVAPVHGKHGAYSLSLHTAMHTAHSTTHTGPSLSLSTHTALHTAHSAAHCTQGLASLYTHSDAHSTQHNTLHTQPDFYTAHSAAHCTLSLTFLRRAWLVHTVHHNQRDLHLTFVARLCGKEELLRTNSSCMKLISVMKNCMLLSLTSSSNVDCGHKWFESVCVVRWQCLQEIKRLKARVIKRYQFAALQKL